MLAKLPFTFLICLVYVKCEKLYFLGRNEKYRDVICPDKRSSCPYGSTCCRVGRGYGCCPLPMAVCCRDRRHCCPKGYRCDLIHLHCRDQHGHTVDMVKKTLVQAVCCPDKLHCCPPGYRCGRDRSAPSCHWPERRVKMQVTTPADRLKSVVCPDGRLCADGSTCCVMASGYYACCPRPYATCCADHIHCCPHGYFCYTSPLMCARGTQRLKPSKKVASSILCPDKKSKCPNSSTCCRVKSGSYGCCPVPKANCCKDHIHCCPHGYTCDMKKLVCYKKGHTIAASLKTAALGVF